MTETTEKVEQVNKALLDKAGKYLTFTLGSEEYGPGCLKPCQPSRKYIL